MSRYVKIIFTVSLVVNVFLLGGIGGYLLKDKEQDSSSWRAAKERMSPEARHMMKETFKDRRQDIQGVFKEMRQKKDMMADVLAADVFDSAAYDQVAAELLVLGMKISEHKMETFKMLAVKLPQDERKNFAPMIASHMSGKSSRRRHRDFSKKSYKQRDLEQKR